MLIKLMMKNVFCAFSFLTSFCLENDASFFAFVCFFLCSLELLSFEDILVILHRFLRLCVAEAFLVRAFDFLLLSCYLTE